jgi:hypothetical protein
MNVAKCPDKPLHGKDWLNHTSIRVYDQGLQVRSGVVPLDDPNNRQSDFLDYKWEKVS